MLHLEKVLEMEINDLDVVTLKDGRQGTVIDIQHDAQGYAYMIEILGIDVLDSPYVREDEIASVDWRCEQDENMRIEASSIEEVPQPSV